VEPASYVKERGQVAEVEVSAKLLKVNISFLLAMTSSKLMRCIDLGSQRPLGKPIASGTTSAPEESSPRAKPR